MKESLVGDTVYFVNGLFGKVVNQSGTALEIYTQSGIHFVLPCREVLFVFRETSESGKILSILKRVKSKKSVLPERSFYLFEKMIVHNFLALFTET